MARSSTDPSASRPTQGDPECRHREIVHVQLDHVALLPAKGLHGVEASVARYEALRARLNDERLGLAEAF